MGAHVYDELAERYIASSEHGPPNARYDRPAIRRLLGPVEGRDVLELGCAAGYLTRDLLDAGARVHAIDRSEPMVAHARRLTGDRARVEVGDLAEPLAGLADASFDLVSASLVLHYLPDWTTPLGEVRRVLRPGGALVLSVHHPITGWLHSDRSDYHRVELIEEEWTVDGVRTTAQMWRRPVSAVLTPLLAAGLVIDAVDEPSYDFTPEQVPDPRMRQALNHSPVFLYVRARRPAA